MDKSNIEIVISRYNEDIQWTEKYKQFVTIYNKGNDPIDDAISLINVGREAHTYLHHIVHNYDNLKGLSWKWDKEEDFRILMRNRNHFVLKCIILNH